MGIPETESGAVAAAAAPPPLAIVSLKRLHINEESSDDNQSEDWGMDESDCRTSSSSEPTPRFSVIALPMKVRNSFFPRSRKPQIQTKDRSSTADTNTTSSASSTPRDSVTLTKQHEENENVEKFRAFWDDKLHTTMEKHEGSICMSDRAQNDVFHLLLKLYAHQDVVEELYSSYDANAAEFEFYIPQLCTFLLHGNYTKQHQLECFLMSRSGESLPFAHRLTWFLRSFSNSARDYQSEYLSLMAPHDPENSDLLAAIGRRAGVPALLMNNGLCEEEVLAINSDNLKARRWTSFPTDNELEIATLDTDESFTDHLLHMRNSVLNEARTDEGNPQQIMLFEQTPKFVEALTDLAEQLIPSPRPQRNSELRKGLINIDEQLLPSDVIYLPIGNSCHRVKRIRVEECFTFSTKERVPYFLCVEVLDYSITSSPETSKNQQKKKKSKTNRDQARSFSLRLPFSKADKDLKVAVDESPMSTIASSEGGSSVASSPSAYSPSPATRVTNASASTDSLTPLQKVNVLAENPMDGEDGDDEKEEGGRKSRKSFQEDENLVKTQVEPQRRSSQWKLLPRPRRRSTKDYSSSASARSGGQFDSFYSSWFSKKANRTAAEGDDVQNVSDLSKINETSAKGSAAPSTKDDTSAATEEVIASSGDDFDERDSSPSASIEAERVDAGANWSSDGRTTVGSSPTEASASFVVKGFQGNLKAAIVASDEPDESESSFGPSEEEAMDEFDVEGADGEGFELSSDIDPVDRSSATWIELSEDGGTDDAEAEDADDEDSIGGFFSDDNVSSRKPKPSPAQKSNEKQASFASWFSRKHATSQAEHDSVMMHVQKDAASCTINEPRYSESGASELLSPAGDCKKALQNEAQFHQRRRDLSVSLDFADPTVWKEKFELEDGLTDSEPDEEAVDTDGMDSGAEEEYEASDDEDEKPMTVLRERWSEKEARIRSESPYGDHPGWRLLSVIVKSNDDLRQEQFAAQLIAQCDRIFRQYSLPLSLRPYDVIATSAQTGLIEAVPDTVSIDSVKRNDPEYTTLLNFYTRLHGDKGTAGFAQAQRNFVESLAAYSMVCYVFQIKDRHNGNILVDTDGHVIHIDFGFLLTNSPGSNWNFERAPFKLTDEFIELMGGPRSSAFRYFRSLCIRAYLALRRDMDQIVLLVEMMLVGNADLPCFAGGKRAVIEGLRARLKPGARTSTCQVFVNQLIDQSMNNWRTRWYDKYQRTCLGIL